MNLEEKRKLILKEVLRKEKRIFQWSKLIGPGIKRKFLRLFLTPDIYLNYLYFRFFSYKKRVKILNLKEVNLPNKNDTEIANLFLGFPIIFQEIKLIKFLVKNLKEDDIFYDIGANYGFYTYLAMEFCKEVHSFEPIPWVFNNLKENLEKETNISLNNIYLNNVAVSNIVGETEFYILKSSTGGSSLFSDLSDYKKNDIEVIKVKTINLDEYIKNHSLPTYIKIDVEGAENLVLEGAENLLKNNSPIIMMEVWGEELKNNQNHKSAVNFLKNLGYQLFEINENGDLKEISEPDYENLIRSDNFIFLKNKKVI